MPLYSYFPLARVIEKLYHRSNGRVFGGMEEVRHDLL